MKVEVLYVAECPSHPAAVKLVRDVLNSEGVLAEVREVLAIFSNAALTRASCSTCPLTAACAVKWASGFTGSPPTVIS